MSFIFITLEEQGIKNISAFGLLVVDVLKLLGCTISIMPIYNNILSFYVKELPGYKELFSPLLERDNLRCIVGKTGTCGGTRAYNCPGPKPVLGFKSF